MRNRSMTLIGGALIGAGLMYYFDPDRGRRRRSLVRNQLVHASHRLQAGMDTAARDIRNRVVGTVTTLRTRLRPPSAEDVVLVERVRARLGRVVSHPASVEISAQNGRVTLTGLILADEVDRLIRRVRSVYGVKEIENRLEMRKESGRTPGLQGSEPRTGERSAFRQTNWPPAARVVGAATGGFGFIYGALRGGVFGLVAAVAGGLLFARAATNLELRRLTGIGTARRAVDVQKTIHINAPVARVFAVWADFENFPTFMSHVRRVRRLEDGRQGIRWRWTVEGPAGTTIEFDTVVTAFEPDRLLAWRTEPASSVQHAGKVHFIGEQDRPTTVEVHMSYNPIAGVFGHAIARLFGADPKHRMDDDLVRMKTYIETGKPPHDAAMPSPGTQPSVTPTPLGPLH